MKKKQTLFSIPSIKKQKTKKTLLKKNREKRRERKMCPFRSVRIFHKSFVTIVL